MAVTNFAQIYDLIVKLSIPLESRGFSFLTREKSTRIENYELLEKYLTKYRNFSGIKFYPALLQKGLDQQSIAGQFSGLSLLPALVIVYNGNLTPGFALIL